MLLSRHTDALLLILRACDCMSPGLTLLLICETTLVRRASIWPKIAAYFGSEAGAHLSVN